MDLSISVMTYSKYLHFVSEKFTRKTPDPACYRGKIHASQALTGEFEKVLAENMELRKELHNEPMFGVPRARVGGRVDNSFSVKGERLQISIFRTLSPTVNLKHRGLPCENDGI